MGSSRSLRSLLLSLVVVAAGCATLSPVPLAPDAIWFDAQLAASQYALASDALQQWRERYPQDSQLAIFTERLDTDTAQLRAAAIADARQLRAQQRWADADQRLLDAQKQLPNDEALQAEYAQFDQLREEQRAWAQHEFDLVYARNLPTLQQHARAVFELKPQDTVAAAQIRALEDTATSMVGRLSVAAQRARQRGDMQDALESLRLAARLSGEQSLGQQAQQLERELEKTAPRPRQKAQSVPASALAGALGTLDESLAKNQLDAAQSQLKTLRAKYPGDAQVEQRLLRFEQQRKQFVSTALEEGRRYYSAGDLTKAIEIWERAYLLDPGNQDLRDRIDRAQRFRAKVESLQ